MERRSLLRRALRIAGSFIVIATASAFTNAMPSQEWMELQQTADGAFTNPSGLAIPEQATSEALAAFRMYGTDTLAELDSAVDFLAAGNKASTENLARLIIASASRGRTVDTLLHELSLRQNPDGGFGNRAGYDSEPLSTAYGLRAIAAAAATTPETARAVSFLLASQTSNGGWDIGGHSSASLTAEVVITLSSFPGQAGVPASMAAARSFLKNRKDINGLWGAPFESALVLSALTTGANSADELSASTTALEQQAEDNGSWANDVYTTALVLQALKRVNSLGAVVADRGSIAGKVILAGSSEPVHGAIASILNTNAQATSDDQGYFTFENIPVGNHTVQIEKTGFIGASVIASVESASLSDLGDIPLGQAGDNAFVRGYIYDAGTLAPISGAAILIAGETAYSGLTGTNGKFEFLDIEPGSYTIVMESDDYHPVSGTLVVEAGDSTSINQALVDTSTPLLDHPLPLSGVVVDGLTGDPIAAATVVIDDQVLTSDGSGRFLSQDVERGAHALTVDAEGYIKNTYELNVPPGAKGDIGHLALYKATDAEPATTLELAATVVDSVSGKPIVGALVNVVGTDKQGTTDNNGTATLSGLTELSFGVELSAPGFVSQQVAVTASSFGAAAVTFPLTPETEDSGTSTVSGVLRDEISQLPIAGGLIKASNGDTVVSAADGTYLLDDIAVSDLLLEVEANGYISNKKALTLGTAGGNYNLDLTLMPVNDMSVLSVVDVEVSNSVEPHTNEIILVEVENQTTELQRALLLVRIISDAGEEVSLLTPYQQGTQVVSPHIEVAGNQRVEFQVPWPVGQTAASNYTVRAEVVELDSLQQDLPRGVIISAGFADTTVEGIPKFGGALDVYPPVVPAGTSTPVSLKAVLRNTGNQLLDTGDYLLEISESSSGEVVHSVTVFVESLDQNQVSELDFGTWTPSVSQFGEYVVTVNRVDDISGNIQGDLYVGDVAKAVFTISQSVLPEGDSEVEGNIRVTGVDTKLGGSVDPLFALVKQSVEVGAAYTGAGAVNWDKGKACLGCHTQAQSLAGLGSALEKANFDSGPAKYLLNAISTGQRSNGSLENSHPGFSKTATLFGSWALTEWPKQEQTYRTRVKALNHLWSKRSTSSGKVYWTHDHPTGWLNNPLAATAMAVLNVTRTMDAGKLLGDAPSDYAWGPHIPMAAGGYGDHALASSEGNIFVAKSEGRLERVDIETGDTEVLFNSVPGVSGRVNGLRRHSNGDFWIATQQGKLLSIDIQGNVKRSIQACSQATGGIVFDASETNVYVLCHAESQLRRIDIATEANELLMSGGILNRPYALAWGINGELFATNYSGANVLQFDLENNSASIFADGLYAFPVGLAVDDSGDLYVTGNARGGAGVGVHRIRPDGTAERLFWGGLPWGVINHNGTLYVGSRNSANRLNAIQPIELDDSILDTYLTNLPSVVQYLNGFNISTTHNQHHATVLMGLSEARRYLAPGDLRDQTDAKIAAIANALRSRQANDGGWSRYGNATNSNRDPLMTALVGIALEYTSPSSDDPMVRNAITYLLNTQKANGAWHSSSGFFSTDHGTTSLVMVYMPKALDRVGGLDVSLGVNMPANIQLLNPTIAPAAVMEIDDGTTQFTWDLEGVTGDGREIDFDLSIADLALNEVRPVANATEIEFSNSFSDEVIINAVDVPSVTAISQLTLELQTDKLSYAANELVDIVSTVQNSGPTFAGGEIRLSIRSSGDQGIIGDLGALGQGSLNKDEEQSQPSFWDTGTTLAGDYEVYGQLVDQNNRVVAEAIAPIAIVTTTTSDSGTVGADVYTDKQTYYFGEDAQLLARAKNLALNALLSPSYGKLVVRDSNAGMVWNSGYAIPQLVPQASFAPQDQLVLADLIPGTYEVSWEIFDAPGVNLLASASTQFMIVDDPIRALTGDVTVGHESVDRGASQSCQFTVSNAGSSDISGAVLTKSIVDMANQSVVVADTQILELPAGASDSSDKPFTTGDYATGVYACVLEAFLNGQSRVLATAMFDVTEPPVKIDAVMANQGPGRLLVLLDEAGGTEQSCKGLSQIDVALRPDSVILPYDQIQVELYDAMGGMLDGESVVVGESAYPVDLNSATAIELSVTDADAGVLMIRLQFPDADKPITETDIQLVATLTRGDNAITFVSDLFGTGCGSIEPAQQLGSGLQVIAVMGLDEPEPYGPRGAPTRLTQRNFIESVLQQMGWSYTIVTNSDDYARELRTEGYAATALFNEQVKLAESVQQELVDAVQQGLGLLYAGYHDQRNGRIEPALGIKAKGKLVGLTGVQLESSTLGDASTEFDFAFDAKPLRAEPQGANPVAYYKAAETTIEPAITTYQHGLGRSVYVGFDLLAEATASGLESEHTSLITAALAHAHPDVIVPIAGRVIPITLTLENQGVAVVGQVLLSLPEGAALVDSGKGRVTSSGQLLWPFNLNEEEQRTLLFWMRLPYEAGALDIHGTISVINNEGQLVPYGPVQHQFDVVAP